LHGGRAVLANLGYGQGEVVLPGGHRRDHSRATARAVKGAAGQAPPGEQDQQVFDPIDDVHRRGRVIDGRREGLDGDVDQDAQRERWVLLDRAFGAEGDHAPHRALAEMPSPAVDLQDHGPGRDVIADGLRQDEQAVLALPDGDQAAHCHRQDHAALARVAQPLRRCAGRQVRRRGTAGGALVVAMRIDLGDNGVPQSGDVCRRCCGSERVEKAAEKGEKEHHAGEDENAGNPKRQTRNEAVAHSRHDDECVHHRADEDADAQFEPRVPVGHVQHSRR
jgi:hypothetical protein